LCYNVYCLQEEYKQVRYKNFCTNLYNLRKALQKLGGKAGAANAALSHNQQLDPIKTNPPGLSYPHWDAGWRLKGF
jgi:hypothetical protein